MVHDVYTSYLGQNLKKIFLDNRKMWELFVSAEGKGNLQRHHYYSNS